jgi:potassium voltage-gated channel Shal-related subfamily D member 2
MPDSIPLAHTGSPAHRLSGSRPVSRASSPRVDTVPHVVSLENVAEAARDIHPRWKRELYLLLEHPTSSPSAFVIHVATTSLIIISAAVTVLETIPSSHSVSGSLWFGLETTLVVLFTVEYIARVVAHSNTWSSFAKWVLCTAASRVFVLRRANAPLIPAFFGIIDLLGILPYYIEIALGQDTVSLCYYSHTIKPDSCSLRFSGLLSSAHSGCCAYSDRSDTITPSCCA